ncbi:DUF4365 domain-containing protein [Promicromonospora sp. NPDC059942]|uniref:DUF4365 domain-containing protein n=1 Tax=Promicromonospora sp. NPDC059942 TaxID=3347009 RepID=UPI0036604F42
MTGTGKKVDKSTHIGAGGVALISLLVHDIGHVWHERHIDAGIDGMIELRNPVTHEMSNRHLLVQSKAQDRPFAGEDETSFHYTCDARDLEYWMQAQDPVLVICGHPKTRQAWWVHVQSYFADPAVRGTRRIEFDKSTMALTGDITDRLFALADPSGRSYTPAADERHEDLISNLLPVDMPAVVHSYPTSHRKPREINQLQSTSGLDYRVDWVVHGGRLYTWNLAEGTSLGAALAGPPTVRPIGELLQYEKDGERLVVRLLNQALRQDLSRDCRWDPNHRFVYFRPTRDLSARRWPTSPTSFRLVFNPYMNKNDPSKVSYYRHAALNWRFLLVRDAWYCELVPDYYYTINGITESRYSADLRSGIKRRERQKSVLQETRMWANILRPQEDLFDILDSGRRILDFGPLMAFPVEKAITDSSWKRMDPNDEFDLFDAAMEDASA